MALRRPNPALATETVTLDQRTLVDGTSGDQSFASAVAATYPAIVTMQRLNHEGLRSRDGQTLAESLWDVLIFNATDPGVLPQKTLLRVVGQEVASQTRVLIANTPSAYREAGCWYVLAQSLD